MRYQSVLCIAAGIIPLAVITVLSSLTSGFVLFRNYISDLGIGQYGVIFNSSLVIASILAMPFIFYLYKEYKYLIVLFLSAALALALVGLFPLTSPVHRYVSAAFFVLVFASILAAGTKMRRKKSRWSSITLAILGFAGMAFFSPFVEVLLVFAIGLWVAAVGLKAKKLYEKG